MRVIDTRNVCTAYAQGVAMLRRDGLRESSRAGEVIVMPEPVATVYQNPLERVLFDRQRDANPFFHLIEALWMLGGRQDAEFLDRYVRDFSARFAEPDGRLHGAYGYRWRNWFGEERPIDQLAELIALLKADPTTRQAVLTMWDPNADLVMPLTRAVDGSGLPRNKAWRDRPCNTHVYFRIRIGGPADYAGFAMDAPSQFLDMTVCCRSNDIVWGAYGANAVHMSVLQEYVAAMVGVRVGSYTQMSNNFHAYTDTLPTQVPVVDDPYFDGGLTPEALVDDRETFDEELSFLLAAIEGSAHALVRLGGARNSFLSDTAWRMHETHRVWRAEGPAAALRLADTVAAPDWRRACEWWLQRRVK